MTAPWGVLGIASISEQVSVPAKVCAHATTPSALKQTVSLGRTAAEGWAERCGSGQAEELGLCNGC